MLGEGRNRQIRRMFEALGLTVLTLRRVAVGSLTLGNLPLGQWRELSPNEVDRLLEEVGDEPSRMKADSVGFRA